MHFLAGERGEKISRGEEEEEDPTEMNSTTDTDMREGTPINDIHTMKSGAEITTDATTANSTRDVNIHMSTPDDKQTDMHPSSEEEEDEDRIQITSGIPLSTPKDSAFLSPLLSFVRSTCVEYFTVQFKKLSNDDNNAGSPIVRRGRVRVQIVEGTVGIRCVFCKNVSEEKRGKQSMGFPTGLDKIRSTVVMWQCRHAPICKSIPQSIRHHLAKLKQQGESRDNGKNHWVSSAKEKGLMDTRNGIMFESEDAMDKALEGADVCRKIGGSLLSLGGDDDTREVATKTCKKREGVYTDVEISRRSGRAKRPPAKFNIEGYAEEENEDAERGRIEDSLEDMWKCCGEVYSSERKRCSKCNCWRDRIMHRSYRELVPQDALPKHKTPKCKIPGCDKFKRNNCDGMCYRHHRRSTAKYDSVEETKKKTSSPRKAIRGSFLTPMLIERRNNSSLSEDMNVRRSMSDRAVNPSPKVRYRDDDLDFTPEILPSKSRGTKRARDEEEKNNGTKGKKTKESVLCMHEGCTRYRQTRCSGYCCTHSPTISEYRNVQMERKNGIKNKDSHSSNASLQEKAQIVTSTNSPAKKKAKVSEDVASQKSVFSTSKLVKTHNSGIKIGDTVTPKIKMEDYHDQAYSGDTDDELLVTKQELTVCRQNLTQSLEENKRNVEEINRQADEIKRLKAALRAFVD